MKILYAASNGDSSKIQLSRFIKEVYDSEHQIKIAAYKKSSPKNLNIDWTLDCLLSMYKPNLLTLDNDNLNIYYDQVKNYKPDLIISDLEYFTSHIAGELNIPLWQCSSSIINFALDNKQKYGLGLFKFYAHSINNQDSKKNQKLINLIDNSDRNFIYSHYGDCINAPKLIGNFEWIRPYHYVGKNSITCHHTVVAGLINNNKDIINILKKYNDSVFFTENDGEKYYSILSKDIKIIDEYYCNIKNSNIFICQGQASFLADAFYNGKFSLIYPNYKDNESIINSQMSNDLDLGKIIPYTANILEFENYKVEINYNNIKYLNQEIGKA